MASPECVSFFSQAQAVPADAIFEVTKRYVADPCPDKVNLGQGTYRDSDGKPWILPSVRMAKEAIAEPGHEYLPIAGLGDFRQGAAGVAFEATSLLEQGRVAACQALSGTGALLLVGMALRKANPSMSTVYITDPTWSNHYLLFSQLGFVVKALPYYAGGKFDADAFMAALKDAEPNSAVVLHACAHNPTGCDPSRDQWCEIASVMRDGFLFPIFDAAYLGFNSGSLEIDGWAVRRFTDELEMEAAVCLSFAKSMGLYGERVGLATFTTRTSEAAATMASILANAQRATVSNPPAYGARLAATVLNTPAFRKQWAKDLVTMSERIATMRRALLDELTTLGTPGGWNHLVEQTGMFGYMGITEKQVVYLEEKHHVYMANTSRISIAGLNEKNVAYFARALDDAVRRV